MNKWFYYRYYFSQYRTSVAKYGVDNKCAVGAKEASNKKNVCVNCIKLYRRWRNRPSGIGIQVQVPN